MKNDFMKHGEEAFALSAKVDEILKENSFWRTGTSSVFIHKSPDVRIVKKPGTRTHNSFEFGFVERQIRDGDHWVTKNTLRFRAFVEAENPLEALMDAPDVLPTPEFKVPGP